MIFINKNLLFLLKTKPKMTIKKLEMEELPMEKYHADFVNSRFSARDEVNNKMVNVSWGGV